MDGTDPPAAPMAVVIGMARRGATSRPARGKAIPIEWRARQDSNL